MARLDRLNARVAVRRTTLVAPAELRALLARPTTEGRLEALRSFLPTTVLAPGAEGEGGTVLARAEGALRAAARAEAVRLLEDVEGAGPRRLLEAFLGLEEAEAVKAVLRGVDRGAPLDAVLAAAPASPALDEEALRAAAAAPDLGTALDALEAAGSTAAVAARAALPLRAKGGLGPVELAIDRAAHARAARACRGGGEDARLLARHLEDRADARNALTLLALAGHPPATGCWLEGGRRLAPDVLSRLAAAGPPAAAGAVAAAFGIPLAAVATPWGADRALESAVLAPLRREARRRPLSLAVPLWYLLARRAEVRRVAVLLRGAALGLAGEELLDLAEA